MSTVPARTPPLRQPHLPPLLPLLAVLLFAVLTAASTPTSISDSLIKKLQNSLNEAAEYASGTITGAPNAAGPGPSIDKDAEGWNHSLAFQPDARAAEHPEGIRTLNANETMMVSLDKQCSSAFFDDVIQEQLAPYLEAGIQKSDLTGVDQMLGMNMTELGTVKIVNNQVYLRISAMRYRLVRFTAFIFAAVACRHKLPDVQLDFEVSGHIYSREHVMKGKPQPPVFAYNRHRVYNPQLLLVPYQLATQSRKALENDLMLDAEMGIWDRRLPVAFWRGTTTGASVRPETVLTLPRSKMLLACKQLGPLCDAKFTKVVQARNGTAAATEALKMEGLIGGHVSPAELPRFKYLLLPDGNVAPTSRSISYFRSSAVVIKAITPFEEFWYPKLIPFHHFLPLSFSAVELNETLKWLRENDDHAERLGKNARQFAKQHLTVDALECYVARLLREYGKALRFSPSLENNVQEGFVPLRRLMDEKLVHQVNEAVGTTCFQV